MKSGENVCDRKSKPYGAVIMHLLYGHCMEFRQLAKVLRRGYGGQRGNREKAKERDSQTERDRERERER